MDAKMEFSNEDITIVWKAKLCQHAAVCVKLLPQVYKPKEKPWVNIENASTDELKAQISKCPSGALSFYENQKK